MYHALRALPVGEARECLLWVFCERDDDLHQLRAGFVVDSKRAEKADTAVPDRRHSLKLAPSVRRSSTSPAPVFTNVPRAANVAPWS
jgi:hypothetical protein